MSSARIPLSQSELRSHLKEQLQFLDDECSSFDAGRSLYAKKIAITLRILLHDQGNGHSLLGQLGFKDEWKWLDSAGPLNSRNLMPENNLVFQRMTMTESGMEPTYEPHLADGPPSLIPADVIDQMIANGVPIAPGRGSNIAFEQWWNADVVKDGDGARFSRRGLVLALANREGGGHVDAGIPATEYRLSRSNSMGWTMFGSELEVPFGNPVLASVRQIAYEARETIRKNLNAQ